MKQIFFSLFLFANFLNISQTIAQVVSRRIQIENFPSFLSVGRSTQTSMVNIEPIDMEAVKKEDAADEKTGQPPRFGRSRQVDIGLESGK